MTIIATHLRDIAGAVSVREDGEDQATWAAGNQTDLYVLSEPYEAEDLGIKTDHLVVSQAPEQDDEDSFFAQIFGPQHLEAETAVFLADEDGVALDNYGPVAVVPGNDAAAALQALGVELA